jgi:hypothetical protein
MAEWFKAAVLKTVVLFTGDRGFKSYSLRQGISCGEFHSGFLRDALRLFAGRA